MWPHIDLTITGNIQAGSIVGSRSIDLNVDTAAIPVQLVVSRKRRHENEPTKGGKLLPEVVPSTTSTVLDIPDSPDSSSKRLRGALLRIKAPGAKIIKKMSRS